VADELFEDPRLAALYDPLEGDRPDLEVYVAMVDELGARDVLDIGCGTGSLAMMLAARSVRVTGVDPAAASLDVARAKPGADAVTWIHGDATTLPPLACDLALMTGNVAQVFVTDDRWLATLRGIRAALRPAGRLAFETRDPTARAWEGWTEAQTRRTAEVPGAGPVTEWVQVTDVVDDGALVTFESPNVFADGTVITSRSTLRFRTRAEVEASIEAAGYLLEEVRDAPDRPGRELVFIASRA
jgi:SAM-dependent methyltransferase